MIPKDPKTGALKNLLGELQVAPGGSNAEPGGPVATTCQHCNFPSEIGVFLTDTDSSACLTGMSVCLAVHYGAQLLDQHREKAGPGVIAARIPNGIPTSPLTFPILCLKTMVGDHGLEPWTR